jgi:hypothetical protein
LEKTTEDQMKIIFFQVITTNFQMKTIPFFVPVAAAFAFFTVNVVTSQTGQFAGIPTTGESVMFYDADVVKFDSNRHQSFGKKPKKARREHRRNQLAGGLSAIAIFESLDGF